MTQNAPFSTLPAHFWKMCVSLTATCNPKIVRKITKVIHRLSTTYSQGQHVFTLRATRNFSYDSLRRRNSPVSGGLHTFCVPGKWATGNAYLIANVYIDTLLKMGFTLRDCKAEVVSDTLAHFWFHSLYRGVFYTLFSYMYNCIFVSPYKGLI